MSQDTKKSGGANREKTRGRKTNRVAETNEGGAMIGLHWAMGKQVHGHVQMWVMKRRARQRSSAPDPGFARSQRSTSSAE